VAGGLSNGVTFLLDGASHNDPFNNLNLPLPFPDALQEFKLETSGLSAQYGQHSAGTVNAVTKSGTNDFHGDLFEFVRNGALNARNAFASDRDTLKRNRAAELRWTDPEEQALFSAHIKGTRSRHAHPTVCDDSHTGDGCG
jgi:hypothetical protein